MSILPKIIVILGPTASGKSGMGIKLAKKYNGEIISCDSRQFYKGMNIGTAKIKKSKVKIKKLQGKNQKIVVSDDVDHYMIDIIKPNQNYSVAEFKEQAEKIIDDILKRGKTPILVGGTGLYIQALVDNLTIPRVAPDFEFRKNLEKQDIEKLWTRLMKLDHNASSFVQRQNKRRIIRALEVCIKTGKTFSEFQQKGIQKYNFLQIGIKVDREKLYKRIDKRVDQMIKNGLVRELKKLNKKYSWKLPAMSGIGYGEFKGKLNKIKDKKILTEIIQNIKFHTHQYARRQESWFKRDKKIKWIEKYNEANKLVKNFLK
ncbi:MAG: tRNA (adenosine(37)-N6)-dimethylallyltransferase MiaA [Patescibacteria group bacterium]|nr:tRNA (adenosine(37)-N6)-dimethylallyltransferase MiaA [Patescibacteria group bacterium]